MKIIRISDVQGFNLVDVNVYEAGSDEPIFSQSMIERNGARVLCATLATEFIIKGEGVEFINNMLPF